MIERPRHVKAIERHLKRNPVVAVLGARQVGKTTLARLVARKRNAAWFDLEDPADRARLAEPELVLRAAKGLVVLDEVQRLPEVFPLLRVLADRPRTPARFLILGSASPDLLRQGSETLAGRIAFHFLPPLSLDEVGTRRLSRLWLRGGLPRSFTARSHRDSLDWRRDFIRTFLERDVPQMGVRIAAATLRRFWAMLAHWHGQTWNASEFGRSFGVSDTTVRGYLDLLADLFVVRQLQPWHENLKKRQVKSPKVYLSDAGLLHALLGLETLADLERHPKLGASWEGFALESTVAHLGAREEECFFWATFSGAELDLLVVRGGRRLGFEFKRTAKPALTKSMQVARDDLRLDELVVVHAGEHAFPLGEGVRAVPLRALLDEIASLR